MTVRYITYLLDRWTWQITWLSQRI